MLLKLSNLNSNLALTLGYLNPALNNSALKDKRLKNAKTARWSFSFCLFCLSMIGESTVVLWYARNLKLPNDVKEEFQTIINSTRIQIQKSAGK